MSRLSLTPTGGHGSHDHKLSSLNLVSGCKVNLYFKSAVYCLLRTISVVSVTSVQLPNSVIDRNQKDSDDVLLLHSSMSL